MPLPRFCVRPLLTPRYALAHLCHDGGELLVEEHRQAAFDDVARALAGVPEHCGRGQRLPGMGRAPAHQGRVVGESHNSRSRPRALKLAGSFVPPLIL